MGTEQEYGTLYWNGQPIGELPVKTMTIGNFETIKLKPLKWYQKIYYFGIIRAYCFITAKIKVWFILRKMNKQRRRKKI